MPRRVHRSHLRARTPVLAASARDVRARVRGARGEQAHLGSHPVDGRADARDRGRHAEAVHLHIHPPGGRERVQPFAPPPTRRRGTGRSHSSRSLRFSERSSARCSGGVSATASAAAPRSSSRRRSSSVRRCAGRCRRSTGTLVACFVMGVSAGGLLADRLLVARGDDSRPRKRRGEAVVLVAGALGTALGFLLASWTAHWLIPTYGWRIMWFFGIPTGLSLILLNRYLPESPRFLFANGMPDQARAVMGSFGLKAKEQTDEPELGGVGRSSLGSPSVFREPYTAISSVLIVYALAWGLVNFGFLVWLPVYVSKSGVSADHVTAILAKAALFAIPGAVLVALLYGRWSSRWTLVLSATVEAATLIVFAADRGVVHNSFLFTALLVVLLVSLPGRPSLRWRRTRQRSIRPRFVARAPASSPARRSSAACSCSGRPFSPGRRRA